MVLNRDGTFQLDKPLRDYAWGLAGHGVAVLRYDQRLWKHAADMVKADAPPDIEKDVIDDALSAFDVLRHEGNVKASRIYLLGQLEAGQLTPHVALRAHNVNGLVIVSASPRKRWEMM